MPRGRCLPLALGIKTRRNGKARYPLRFRACAAFHFSAGVVQRLPSTPAVLLPRFSVTRLTAKYLAAGERVKERCRRRTRRHSPFLQAFAIRFCIVLTDLLTRSQLISYQLSGRRESADTGFSMCSTMQPSLKKIRTFSAFMR